MISTLIIFAAVLSLLVLVHEFGHFITARKSGVAVEEFGFGFPPRIIGIKRGGTTYSINWIPLGGFVKIKGETGEYRGDKDSFASKKAWQRALILLAGVIMNFVLAWALLTVGYLIGLPQAIEDLSPYARVTAEKTQVVSVLKGSAAEKADLRTGDTVAAVDGKIVSSIETFREYTAGRKDTPVGLTIIRDGQTIQKSIAPLVLKETGHVGIGVALVRTGLVSYPWYLAPVEGLSATISFTREVLDAFYGLLRDLVVTQRVTAEFSGPVGIAVLTAEVAKLGIRYLLQFTALLSVNLAIINVLPFPALDGGRMLFLIIECVRGKSVGRKIETITHNIGFALLMLLVLVVTYRDVVRFGDRILKAAGSLFGV